MAALIAVNWPLPAASTMTVPIQGYTKFPISSNKYLPEATKAEEVVDDARLVLVVEVPQLIEGAGHPKIVDVIA